MKKIALALAGASVALTGLMATPAAAADFGGHDRGRYEQGQNRGHQQVQNRGYQQVQNRGYQEVQNRGFDGNRSDNRFQARSWQRGDRFDSRYATDYMVISNPGYYDLGAAPYGYRWVRSGNDAVLVAIAGGIIGALVANAF
ncbi:MAG TPA: RcnB family protein [Sphingomicrobium sp.]|nr:RcnB family protein [Sphingomicrobium sp.]